MSSGESRSPYSFPLPKKPFTIPSLGPPNCIQLCIVAIQHIIFLPHELFHVLGSVVEDKLADCLSRSPSGLQNTPFEFNHKASSISRPVKLAPATRRRWWYSFIAQNIGSWINSSSSFIGLVIPMVSFRTVAATLSFLFPLSSSHLLTMNMECYETQITDISATVEEVRAVFKSGKTLPIAFRKEQLRQFWKLAGVRGTRSQRLKEMLTEC